MLGHCRLTATQNDACCSMSNMISDIKAKTTHRVHWDGRHHLLISSDALCAWQTRICDICTHARWVYNTFITGIRSSDEAERALTCGEQQNRFHISLWTNKARGPPAPLCWLEAFSEGLCDQAGDAHSSSLEAERGIWVEGQKQEGGEGRVDALRRLNHARVCKPVTVV